MRIRESENSPLEFNTLFKLDPNIRREITPRHNAMIQKDAQRLDARGVTLLLSWLSLIVLNMSKERTAPEESILLHAEEVTIEKYDEVVGTTTLRKSVSDQVVDVSVDLAQSGYEIVKRPMNKVISEMPKVRYEGETMIIPIVEERLIKQLILVEEVVVEPRTSLKQHKETISLKKESLDVERSEES